jgi:signal transduction histidine kinase
LRVGRALFGIVRDHLEALPDGRILERLSIPEPFRDSPEFFYAMRGAMRAAPRQLDLADARVEMSVSARCAEYIITPPPSGSLASVVRRLLRRTVDAPAALRELGEQQREVADGYRALSRAHSRIARQARRLERQNLWARELTNQIELEPLTRTIVGLLKSNGPYQRVGIWLEARDGTAQQLHADPEIDGVAVERHQLRVGGHSVGHLALWDPLHQQGILDFDDILPWISVALDNARAYAEIQAKNRALESEVAERLRVEAERQRLSEQMLQTQKLESLGIMARGIAHDFNNLLVGILGNAQYALRCQSIDESRSALAEIEKASEQASGLVNSLLAYAGEHELVPQTIDLSDLVNNTIPLVQSAVSKHAHFELLPRPQDRGETPWVRADVTQIRQVLMNLAINGAEALPSAGGRVRIRTGVVTVEADELENYTISDSMVVGRSALLEVEDSGAGIEGDLLHKIFDPFYSTKFVGRGLGLAAVLGIVRGHRGALAVSSEPGRGTCFRVLLPLAEAPATAPRVRPAGRPAPASPRRVLVLDDETQVLAMTERALALENFSAETFSEAREALRSFRREPTCYAAAIVDLTMPDCVPEEVFEALRKANPEIGVVFFSGRGDRAGHQLVSGRSRTAFVRKPFRIDALIGALHDVLAED